jgi:hypothetical protein
MVLTGFLALLAAGCGAGKPGGPKEDPEATHLSKVAQLLKEYETSKKKSPKSVDELKAWAIKEGKADEPDFKSTRDDQPYVMTNGILHEASGKDGQMFMVTPGGTAANEGNEAQIKYMAGQSGMPGANKQGPGPPGIPR